MSDRCNAANCEAGFLAYEGGVCAFEFLPDKNGRASFVDMSSTGGDEEVELSTIRTGQDDGLCDLVQLTASFGGRLGCCSCFAAHFHDVWFDAGGFEGGADAFQALAHEPQSDSGAGRVQETLTAGRARGRVWYGV